MQTIDFLNTRQSNSNFFHMISLETKITLSHLLLKISIFLFVQKTNWCFVRKCFSNKTQIVKTLHILHFWGIIILNGQKCYFDVRTSTNILNISNTTRNIFDKIVNKIMFLLSWEKQIIKIELSRHPLYRKILSEFGLII